MNALRSPATSSLARRIAPCMPSASGVRSTSAPRARMMITFSWEKFSGPNSFIFNPRFIPFTARRIQVFKFGENVSGAGGNQAGQPKHGSSANEVRDVVGDPQMGDFRSFQVHV